MRAVSAILPLLCLVACASLPRDGPSARAVNKYGEHIAGPQDHSAGRYAVVDLDYAVSTQIAAHPPAALTGLADQSSLAPTDLVAEGDVVAVSIYEAGGGGLFSRSSEAAVTTGGDTQQTLPRLIIDPQGNLALPFAGTVHVAGLRPREAAEAIREALVGRAINPQVTVTVLESRANSVSILGEVKNSGHYLLTAHNDRVLDVLATAGGPTRPPADLMVVVSRGGRQAEVRLGALMDQSAQNIRLAPQDQIRILFQPRKYSTFGALMRDSQTLIEDDTLTLAAALSRGGGLDTNSAYASSVMVFRFERPDVARALGVLTPAAPKGVPIVYRLNLRQPAAMFIANNFEVRSDDLLYVPRSDFTEAQKFFALVDSVTQIGYNLAVAGTLAQ